MVVSEGTVLQEGGQAKAFLDSSGTPVVIENLSNGHLERVAFNVLGTEVRILPNQEVLHIRPMEEAESVVKGNNLKIEDTSTAYPPFTDVWGSANISPIAVYEVSMESWDIVQPDEDAYTFSVARASFAYSWNGVIYHGQAFLRKSIPFGSSLNRSVNTINSEEYGGIRSIGLEFLQKETEIQNYEAMVLSTNLGQYFDPIAISAWGVMSTGSIENLEAALSAGQALLGNPNSSFIPTGISNAR